MKILLFVFISLFFIQCSSEIYRKDDFYSQATLKAEREKFYSTTINQTINQSLSLPLTDSTESKYTSAFWAMELLQFRNEITDKAISNSFTDFQNRSIAFQRALMEVIYTLYQSEFVDEIKSLLPKINNSKIFAMCIHYLKEAEDIEHLKRYTEIFESKFMRPEEDPIIKMLNYDLNTEFRHKLNTPPLIDLLKINFGSDKIVIYSFQRLNRDYPGLVLIKKPDGKFLRDKSGEIFSVPQLARAITDLPGYITNGNTPEGILSIQGTDVSKNTFIGPSPNLQLVIPFEVTPEIYFHKSIDDSVWSFDLYKNLLPESWQDYLPIYESYYAGKAGRNEIIAHGTTIAPQFYNDKSYYPFTPSLGCLTTKEIWSEETGRLVESDQLKFMNALLQFSELKGYLIVVNIDDKHSAVELREIKDLILLAENNL
ncbi:hypothetical protein [Ignavibacterium sp.]|uniref:hypothetical protein n=1 Tax=Ignavibacterium sp. TaxID=2651167 RepID=UPI00220EEED3|nr:hypothetical protein [Ignavibacterium sp.]BDQ04480.1 MAG: hypothetical protein KatS3mg037_3055 [Ignavibacterium sp.]